MSEDRVSHKCNGVRKTVYVGLCPNILMIFACLVYLSSCRRQFLWDNVVYENMSTKELERLVGEPNAISERSGDLERLYRPGTTHQYKWPRYAEKTYYYLDLKIQITTKYGRVLKVSPIEEERSETVRSFINKPYIKP